nr:hypothetical protein [Tanacetum cinerariifolium]
MIATPGEPNLPVPVLESFHEQTNEELTETDTKQMDANDQAIQTIRWGLPKDIYAVVDSCETAKEILERVRQMMKENIASNLKFLNNLQPEWKRHVTIVRQTKNIHETDFTQIYDFLKMNQEEYSPTTIISHHNKYNPQPSLNQNFMQPPMTSLEDINDPTEAMNTTLILFAKAFQLFAPTNNNQRTSSNPRNRQLAQPNQQGFNTWQNGGIQGVHNAGMQSGGNQNRLVVVPGIANQSGTGNVVAARAEVTGNVNQARCYNCRGVGHISRNCTARPRRMDAAYLQTQRLIAQKEEAGIQLQAEEFDFMVAAGDLDKIEEVNANCILIMNLQQASTSSTQHDRAPVYDTDGSAEVQLNDNCYDNEIFNMFTQEEQYTDLLEPIPEPHLVPQNDNHVTSVAPSTVQSGGTVETSFAPNEEIRAHQETVYRNLVEQVAQKMALGYPNPSYLKKAQQKQQSLYNGNFLLKEHDPPAVYDSEETLELAQESREKMRLLKKEIKPANYSKINHLSGVFVPQTTKSKKELFLSNVSNMVTASKMISIPNEDLSDDTTPSVARKFLNEVKSSLVTLQRVVKQKMTLEVHNWSYSAHKE